LLSFGVRVAGTNSLKHMLDREDPEGLQLLLSAGIDPNELNGEGETALHWAVWRRRSPHVLGMLVDNGTSIDAKRNDGRTAYAMAAQSGQAGAASFLEKRGASTDLTDLDRFVASCAVADESELKNLLAEAPKISDSANNERLLP